MNKELKKRIIKTLNWMVTDIKWREDHLNGDFDEFSQGGYSPELTEAIKLLEELRQGDRDEKEIKS